MNARALELSKEAKERLRTLEALSEKAEGGDMGAKRDLREAVRESAPKSSPELRTSAGAGGGR